MTKLLVAIGYFDGDRVQMERLADLAVDLLDKPTKQAELLFLGRYDAEPPSPEIYQHCKEKMPVHYWRCNRVGWGFPDGCSQLAYGLFQYIQDHRRVNRFYLDIDAILLMEADCVFTRKTWVEELCAEWEKGKAQGKMVVGAVQPGGKWGHDVEEHVNAVGLYDADILNAVPALKDGPTNIGWDYFHRKSTMPLAMNTPLIKLDWKKQSITEEELYADPKVLIYHGTKDHSAVIAARKRNGI